MIVVVGLIITMMMKLMITITYIAITMVMITTNNIAITMVRFTMFKIPIAAICPPLSFKNKSKTAHLEPSKNLVF